MHTIRRAGEGLVHRYLSIYLSIYPSICASSHMLYVGRLLASPAERYPPDLLPILSQADLQPTCALRPAQLCAALR